MLVALVANSRPKHAAQDEKTQKINRGSIRSPRAATSSVPARAARDMMEKGKGGYTPV